MPWSGGRSYYRLTEISSFTMDDGNSAYPALLNLQQPFIEDFLVQACAGHPNVTLVWDTEVTGVSQDDDGVTVTAGPARTLRGRWLVAADGARSRVRDLLGVQLHGRSYANQFVIADIRMSAPHRPAERGCWFDPPAFPGRTVLLHKQPFDIWRIDYQVHGDEDPQELLKDEQLLPRIGQHLKSIGEDAPWALDWSSLYRAHALSLERYRHHRVLFIGDAAHLLPIFGVRGMNSGWADATNLAWKLAAVVAGDADETLLDSFDAEQRGAFAQNRAYAHKSTLFMTPGSAGATLARDAVVQLALADERFGALADPRYSRPTHHRASSLNLPDSGPGWLSGFKPGELIPNVSVVPVVTAPDSPAGPPVFLFDVLGNGFATIVFGAPVSGAPVSGAPVSGAPVSGAPVSWAPVSGRTAASPGSRGMTVIRVLRAAPASAGPASERPAAGREGAEGRIAEGPATGEPAGPESGETVLLDADGSLAALFGAADGDGYVLRPDCYVAARRRAMPGTFPAAVMAAVLHPAAPAGPAPDGPAPDAAAPDGTEAVGAAGPGPAHDAPGGGPAGADVSLPGGPLDSPGAPDVPESVPASALEHAWLRLGEVLDKVADAASARREASGTAGADTTAQAHAGYLARLCLLLAAELDRPATFDALAARAMASGTPERENSEVARI
jgi:3-(3-hydroxy-phenyl)propionate hydroxylase